MAEIKIVCKTRSFIHVKLAEKQDCRYINLKRISIRIEILIRRIFQFSTQPLMKAQVSFGVETQSGMSKMK